MTTFLSVEPLISVFTGEMVKSPLACTEAFRASGHVATSLLALARPRASQPDFSSLPVIVER